MAAVAPAPVDRSKLGMTANQFPLIGGPLLPAGADVARALFPAHGTVKATGCSVAWSDNELAPLVPMAAGLSIEGA